MTEEKVPIPSFQTPHAAARAEEEAEEEAEEGVEEGVEEKTVPVAVEGAEKRARPGFRGKRRSWHKSIGQRRKNAKKRRIKRKKEEFQNCAISAMDVTVKIEIDEEPIDVKPELDQMPTFDRHYAFLPEYPTMKVDFYSATTSVHVKQESDPFTIDEILAMSGRKKNQTYNEDEESEEIPSGCDEEEWSDSDDDSAPRRKERLDLEGSSDDEDFDEYQDGSEDDEDDEDLEWIPNRRLQEAEQRLKNTSVPHRHTTWIANKDNAYAGQLPPFLGTEEIFCDGGTPYSFFCKLFPNSLCDEIVKQSNIYAFHRGKDSFELTSKELSVFLGINIVMTYIRYPTTRMYWSAEEGLRLRLIANAMTYSRFVEIIRYLHFVDSNDILEDNEDKFIHVRPVLDALHESFHSAASPGENQAVGEMIIPFKGRFHIRKYNRKVFGFKVSVRASVTGYVSCFEMHQGRGSSVGEETSELGPVGDAVYRLCHDLKEKNHKLFLEKPFTSLPLLCKLRQDHIYATGRVSLKSLQKVDDSLLSWMEQTDNGRGSSAIATSDDNITAISWIDQNAVHLISSFCGLIPQDKIKCWARKKKQMIKIDRPNAMRLYSESIRGVTLMNRMMSQYPHSTKQRKWYFRVFYHFLNMAIVNAWILFRQKTGNAMSLIQFRASVAATMIRVGTVVSPTDRPDAPVRKKRRFASSTPAEVRCDGEGHYSVKRELHHAPRCHDVSCKKRTRYACGKCDEPVCPECMENFHSRLIPAVVGKKKRI